jgi:hypothetical protein
VCGEEQIGLTTIIIIIIIITSELACYRLLAFGKHLNKGIELVLLNL